MADVLEVVGVVAFEGFEGDYPRPALKPAAHARNPVHHVSGESNVGTVYDIGFGIPVGLQDIAVNYFDFGQGEGF